MSFDLRREPWIPWRRASGRIDWGPPALLLDRINDDPVVAIATPRPDFDGALQEFLVGLLTVALRPADDDEWLSRWDTPPSPDELDAALNELPPAFDLDGDGARFLQDRSAADLADSPVWAIESLLIGTAGTELAEAQKRTVVTELFGKPARFERLGRPAAAMALLTLQTYSPEGGRGHLTSMRGGGPLTTLVDPRAGADADRAPLWRKLWANVETQDRWAQRTTGDTSLDDYARVFPWLAETRSSERPRQLATAPSDAHPLQAYFGMPRRIRLEFGEAGRCELTGRDDAATVRAFRMRANGVKYTAWRHPLSPYSQDPGGEWRALRAKSGGIGWRDWLGLATEQPQGGRVPAHAVSAFMDRARWLRTREVRIHAFGYATEHKKALAWTDGQMPLFTVEDAAVRSALRDTAAALVAATDLTAGVLMGAVKGALFQDGETAGDLSAVKAQLWAATESPFYDLMRRIAEGAIPAAAAHAASGGFLPVLRDAALDIFDRWASMDGAPPTVARRIVRARYALVMTLGGYSKLGEKLFTTLKVPLPGGGISARKQSRSRKKKETPA